MESGLYKQLCLLVESDDFLSVVANPDDNFHEFSVFILLLKHVCEWSS